MANLTISEPTALASSLAQARGHELKTITRPSVFPKQVSRQNWDDLKALGTEITLEVGTFADQIKQSDDLIMAYGCKHVHEYALVKSKATKMLNEFVNDLLAIKAKHEGRTGFVKDEEENTLLLNIFEDYRQFQSYFQGSMMHTMISFTEYALEANDVLKELEAKKASEQSAAGDA